MLECLVQGDLLRAAQGVVRPEATAPTKAWEDHAVVVEDQAIERAELGDASSVGPNIMSDGQYQRFTASCAICFCSGVPFESSSKISKPWRW